MQSPAVVNVFELNLAGVLDKAERPGVRLRNLLPGAVGALPEGQLLADQHLQLPDRAVASNGEAEARPEPIVIHALVRVIDGDAL